MEPLSELWDGVDRLIDAHPRLDDLWAHGLHLLAGRRWRARGAPVPEELDAAERLSALGAMAAPSLLARVRETLAGPVLVLKGPVAAARYPDPVLRPFGDLDLLVADPEAAQGALIAAGFRETGDSGYYASDPGLHHRCPIAWPGLPTPLELHRRPKWPRMGPPPFDELLGAAVPAAGLPGILTLPPAHHALVLAAHGWAHAPLSELRDLVDVAVMAAGARPADLDALARRWRMEGVWRATRAAIDAFLLGRRRMPVHLRPWTGHLAAVRVRGRAAAEVAALAAVFLELPAGSALRVLARRGPARLRSYRAGARDSPAP